MKPEELKQLRNRLGLTQKELAEKSGYTRAQISHFERGYAVIPNKARIIFELLEKTLAMPE